jgi:hypothetical protein
MYWKTEFPIPLVVTICQSMIGGNADVTFSSVRMERLKYSEAAKYLLL